MAFDKFRTTDQRLDDLGEKLDTIIRDLDLLLASKFEQCTETLVTEATLPS